MENEIEFWNWAKQYDWLSYDDIKKALEHSYDIEVRQSRMTSIPNGRHLDPSWGKY